MAKEKRKDKMRFINIRKHRFNEKMLGYVDEYVKFNTYCNFPRVTATQNKGCCNNPWIFILSKLCKLGLYCII